MLTLILGLTAGTFCTISFLPQVIKVCKSRHTKDLSLITFAMLSLGVLLWLIYGLIKKDIAIILANALTLVLTIIILIMKLRYR